MEINEEEGERMDGGEEMEISDERKGRNFDRKIKERKKIINGGI